MAQVHIRAYRGLIVLAVLMVTLAATFGAAVSASVADVTAVTSSAYGYYSNVGLFGGDPSERGPEPTVSVAADASNSPQEASVDSASAVYGPAELLRAGPIDVQAQGSLGVDGSATSSSRVQADPDPEARLGPFLWDAVDSTCTADGNGVNASATVTNGVVETKYNADTQEPEETVPVPDNPEPGHTVEGTLDHVGDRFRIMFNEQVENPDGSTTVNAVHVYLLGAIAVGDLIIGQSVCGVTATPVDTTTTEPTITPLTVPITTTAPEAGDLDGSATAQESGGAPIAAALIGALVLVAIVVGALVARRARGGADDGSTPGTPDGEGSA
ncbi:MAG TPA: hypothetical protein VM287_05745 [Egibacteraceae bacterium]|nr:hypothetical protein [Egibacteraceae bacterium]